MRQAKRLAAAAVTTTGKQEWLGCSHSMDREHDCRIATEKAPLCAKGCGWRRHANCNANRAEGVPPRHASSRIEHSGDCHASFYKGITGFGALILGLTGAVYAQGGGAAGGGGSGGGTAGGNGVVREALGGNAERKRCHRLDAPASGIE